MLMLPVLLGLYAVWYELPVFSSSPMRMVFIIALCFFSGRFAHRWVCVY
jgi:hypothetical protein